MPIKGFAAPRTLPQAYHVSPNCHSEIVFLIGQRYLEYFKRGDDIVEASDRQELDRMFLLGRRGSRTTRSDRLSYFHARFYRGSGNTFDCLSPRQAYTFVYAAKPKDPQEHFFYIELLVPIQRISWAIATEMQAIIEDKKLTYFGAVMVRTLIEDILQPKTAIFGALGGVYAKRQARYWIRQRMGSCHPDKVKNTLGTQGFAYSFGRFGIMFTLLQVMGKLIEHSEISKIIFDIDTPVVMGAMKIFPSPPQLAIKLPGFVPGQHPEKLWRGTGFGSRILFFCTQVGYRLQDMQERVTLKWHDFSQGPLQEVQKMDMSKVLVALIFCYIGVLISPKMTTGVLVGICVGVMVRSCAT